MFKVTAENDFMQKTERRPYYVMSARKHIKFEIGSFCYLLTFSQVIDTKA